MRALFRFIAVYFVMSAAGYSATFEKTSSPGCQTVMRGEIVKGDSEILRELYLAKGLFKGNVHGEALCLNSPGGALAEALKMGRFLHDYGIRTRLDKDAICLSACAVLFMLGTEYADHGAGDFSGPFGRAGDAA